MIQVVTQNMDPIIKRITSDALSPPVPGWLKVGSAVGAGVYVACIFWNKIYGPRFMEEQYARKLHDQH